MARDHLVTGIGPGQVKRVYPQYAAPEVVNKTRGHLHDTPMVSRLHDLGIQQPWGRHEQWFGIAASIPLAWRLMPHAVGMEQSLSILG